MPISCRAASRGRRVSVSSVMQYRTSGRIARSPTCSTKLVSVAPRSSRLNSSIFPRLRSHPIQRRSRSFHCRARWNRKNRSRVPARVLRVERLDAAQRAAARISVVEGQPSASGASRKSLRMAKWMLGSTLPSACTSRCATRSRRPLDAVEERRHDDHRARGRPARARRSSRGSRRGGIRRAITAGRSGSPARSPARRVSSATRPSVGHRQPWRWAYPTAPATSSSVPAAMVPR